GTGMYYAKKSNVNNSVTTSIGFVKLFPTTISIIEQEKFSHHLAEYGFRLSEYLDYCKNHKQAKSSTQYGFSELAETLFESDHYRSYVEYDKTKIMHPISTSLSANLSDKITDTFPTSNKRREKSDHRRDSSSSQSRKRQRKSSRIARQK
ncbi:unnamed protein product, partial [Didymodactylos carnosus]